MFHWTHSTAFYERVERLGLHGLDFQHVSLCQRRAWMELHGIYFAQWNSRVARGIALHQTHYLRDHSVQGLMGLYPDRIDWDARIVYEQKGGAGAREAVDDQAAFYALMLSIATKERWEACVRIVPGHGKRRVVLDDKRLERLWQASLVLERLASSSQVPKAKKIPLCASCSLARFCGFG